MMKTNYKGGFTLLEILLVVAAIAILAGVVIVALNPAKQLGDTRDAERQSDVNTILNAFYQYSLDNQGSFPRGLDGDVNTVQVLGTGGSCSNTCTAATSVGCIDVTPALAPDYIVAIPRDPINGSDENTYYYVNTTSSGRLVVGACSPEQTEQIEITR